MKIGYDKLMEYMYGDGFVRVCCHTCSRWKRSVWTTGSAHRCGSSGLATGPTHVCGDWNCSRAAAAQAVRLSAKGKEAAR